MLRFGAEKLVASLQPIFKEVLSYILQGKSSTTATANTSISIQFDLPETAFEAQTCLSLYPKVILLPIETFIRMLTVNLSEKTRDFMVSLLADLCAERLEFIINQVYKKYLYSD